MEFVDGNWRVQGVLGFALLHPVLIRPGVFQIPHQGGRTRWFFVEEAEWIRLVHHIPLLLRNDVILVNRTLGHSGNEPLPNPRTPTRLERMRAVIPPVEAANDGHAACIRRPDTEICTRLITNRSKMGAQGLVGAVITPLVEKIEILLSQKSHFSATSGPTADWFLSLEIRVNRPRD